MSVRTYNPSVRVGNWNEDIQLEEDTLKDFLEQRDQGNLLIQKSGDLRGSILEKADLSIARDGWVHFGDVVMLMNPAPKDQSRKDSAFSVNVSLHTGGTGPTTMTGSSNTEPCARNAFVITSMDGSPNGQVLNYGQPFYLKAASTGLFVYSDRATFQKAAKKSRHNEVTLVSEASHLTEWQIQPFHPQFRLELEHSPVPANQNIILVHTKTNQDLCLEEEYTIRTTFGREYEISAFTNLDSHKAEKDCNHWRIMMNVPGDYSMPVAAP